MIRSCFLCMFLLVFQMFQFAQTGDKKDQEKPVSPQKSISEALKMLPLGGSPWALFNLFPGVMLNGTDVGGSLLDQKVVLLGLGAPVEDTTWHMDGANISDPGSIGVSPNYLNTNLHKEMQVTTGTHDVSSQTGGVQVNFVTRSGGNRLSGDIYGFSQGKELEMKQKLADSMVERGESSAGINSLLQYGLSLGGPIWKDKIWFFGAYGMQDIETRDIWGMGRPSQIASFLGKLDFQLGSTSGSIQYQRNGKTIKGMPHPGATNYDPETVWDLHAPHDFSLAKLGQVWGNLELNARFSMTDNQYTLDPRGADINPETGRLEGQDWYYYRTPQPYYSGSLSYYKSRTKGKNISFGGRYFAESFLGGDHEIRFGVDYYKATTTSQQLHPNQRTLFIWDREDPDLYKEIWWTTDGKSDVGFERSSFYLSDEINLGRLNIYLGIRYDRETNRLNHIFSPGVTLDGQSVYPDYIKELDRPAREIFSAYETFSPRISLSYDFSGEGDAVIQAAYGRYGSQAGNRMSSHVSDVGLYELDTFWHDDNGNMKPDWGEFGIIFDWWGPWELPVRELTYNPVDPEFGSPILDAFTISYIQGLGEDVSARLEGSYKKRTNLIWSRGFLGHTGLLETGDNWYKGGVYTFASGLTTDYYLRYTRPDTTYLTNHSSGQNTTYKAIQLLVSKKLSHGWMLDASFTWQDWRQHLDEAETFDKTNFDFYNGGAYAPQALGEGMNGVYVNSRWLVKVAGMVQLPLGINLSGVFQAREGYITPYYEMVFRPGIGWSKIYEPGKKFGDDRLPAFWMLDLGLEKSFRLSDTALLTLLLNGYNITNNTSTLNIDTLLGTENTGEILRVLNPGIFQFGARLSF